MGHHVQHLLELGFSEEFFLELLFRNGLVATHVPGVERFVGPGWRAVHASDGMPFAQLALPAHYAAGFHPAAEKPDWGRLMRAGEVVLPGAPGTSCRITLNNYGPRDLAFAVRSGDWSKTFAVPGQELDVHVPSLAGDMHLESDTYVPHELLGNGDTRVLGVAVKTMPWLRPER